MNSSSPKNPKKWGLLAGLVPAAGWGAIGLWVKNIPMDAFTLTGFRLVGTFLILLLEGWPRLSRKEWLKGAVCGAVLFVQFLATIAGFELLNVGEAGLLNNLHLLWIELFGFLFFRKAVRKNSIPIFHLGLLLVGILLVFKVQGDWTPMGVFFALSSSALFGIYTLLLNFFFPTDSQKARVPIFGTGAILGLPFLLLNGIEGATLVALPSLAALLLFSTFAAHSAYIYSVEKTGPVPAAVLSYFAIPIGFLVDLALGQTVTPLQGLGVLLTTGALIVMVLKTTLPPPEV